MTRRAPVTALLCAFMTLAASPSLPPGLASASPSGDWRWPVDGEVVTHYRNGDDPYARGQHRGIDIAAPAGSAVSAATAGRVTFAGTVGSSGSTVSIRTADGRFDTSYLHLGSVGVAEGDAVGPGSKIGTVGATGGGSVDRPHLHFGVRDAGTDHAYRDPLGFLGSPPSSPRPVPVVVPRRPVSDGAPALSPIRVRVPAPAGGRAPGRARAPRGAPARAPVPAGLPSPARALRGGHAPAHAPADAAHGATAARPAESRGEPAAGHAPAGSPATRPELGPDGPRSATDHGVEPARAPEPGQRPASVGAAGGHGPNAGWIVACVGLIVAAAALTRRERVAKAAGRSRAALGAVLRPLWRGG